MESVQKEIPIMLRVHNKYKYLQDTLDMISNQSVHAKIFVFACEPSQDIRLQLDPYVEHIYTISQETYDNWHFLNRSMEMSEDDLVVFLDAECTPVDVHWLAKLLEPCRRERAGAAFSRKLPRSDANPLIMNDMASSFGEHGNLLHANNRHAFSIDSMVCRKSAWQEEAFPEQFGRWAPFVWSWHARRRGTRIIYAKYSRVLFYERYAPRYWYRRAVEEGTVEAMIFSWEPSEISFRSYCLHPWRNQVIMDWTASASQRKFSMALYAPVLRAIQYHGKYLGFKRTYSRRA